jgi:hypothetical protein
MDEAFGTSLVTLLREKSHGKDGNPPMSCTIGGTAVVTIV